MAGGVARIAPSPLAPLSLLRGSLEYLEIIGAVIAIALGYLTISRERANRTLTLIRSRPVSHDEHAAGSLLGALTVIATLVAITAIVGIACVGVIGNDWINATQGFKLLLAYLAAIIYMGVFYCVGAIATANTRVAANGLMIALGIWLLVVLILPQLGDTLDADNQIPGGLFSALGLDRNGETTILEHFKIYETTRTTIEEVSFSKHFERFAFAMTDVKDKYRGFSLGQLLNEKRNDIGWVLVDENNVGADGNATDDHLEIALSNTGTTDGNGFEVYATFTDPTHDISESYYTKLPASFTIPAGGTRIAHFDNTGAPDHFPVNEFSIYKTSPNAQEVTVEVAATDVAVQTAIVMKDAGGAETAD